MARKAAASVGAMPSTGADFWSKPIEEKKAVFDSLHPSQHSGFFNKLGAAVRYEKDPAKQAEMADHRGQLKEHQKTVASRSLGHLFTPVSPQAGAAPGIPGSTGPDAMQQAARIDDEPASRTGIQGALASGQPVAVHYRQGTGDDAPYTFRAVSPGNLQNFLSTGVGNARTIHVTHRKAGSAAEPAHTTTLSRNQVGAWEETSNEVHPPDTVSAQAPFVAFTKEQAGRRASAEASARSKLAGAQAGVQPAEMPSGIGLFIHGNMGPRGTSVAEDLHHVMMRNDPEYRQKFFEKAGTLAGQETAVEKAEKGLSESVQRTKELKGGRMSMPGAPESKIPSEYDEYSLNVKSSGGRAAGGPSEQTPVERQGTIWARPMDKQDHAIMDTINLAHSVQHGSSQHLLAASPQLQEFDSKKIPEIGTGMIQSADDQKTHAMGMGVEDAKNSTHASGLLGDVHGSSDHPPEINGFKVHHYVSRVAAEAGVDTDEGRMSAIIENARRLQSERQQAYVMGQGLGMSARSMAATQSASGGVIPGGETRVRSHASRDLPAGGEVERFYREGLHRTVSASLASFSNHLANDARNGAASSSGESAFEGAKAHIAARNGVPTLPPSEASQQPNIKGGHQPSDDKPVNMGPQSTGYEPSTDWKEEWEGTGQAYAGNPHAQAESDRIKKIKVKTGADTKLDAQTDAFLAKHEATQEASKATPTTGAAGSAELSEHPEHPDRWVGWRKMQP